MKLLVLASFVAGLMAASSIAGIVARPDKKVQTVAGQKFELKQIVPTQFGDWRLLPDQTVQVVNPQTRELIDSLYSQTLTRTYVNTAGYRIMLSLAYGDDQRGGLALHKPEVCYPAQGFTVLSNQEIAIGTKFGEIPARQINTAMGRRTEPLTYWFTVGNTAIKSHFQQRMVQLQLGLSGEIPDGLLFRVSSIDDQTARAFKTQQAFVSDLLGAVGQLDRTRLSGLGKPI